MKVKVNGRIKWKWKAGRVEWKHRQCWAKATTSIGHPHHLKTWKLQIWKETSFLSLCILDETCPAILDLIFPPSLVTLKSFKHCLSISSWQDMDIRYERVVLTNKEWGRNPNYKMIYHASSASTFVIGWWWWPAPVIEGCGEVGLEDEGEGKGEDDGDERHACQDGEELHPFFNSN